MTFEQFTALAEQVPPAPQQPFELYRVGAVLGARVALNKTGDSAPVSPAWADMYAFRDVRQIVFSAPLPWLLPEPPEIGANIWVPGLGDGPARLETAYSTAKDFRFVPALQAARG